MSEFKDPLDELLARHSDDPAPVEEKPETSVEYTSDVDWDNNEEVEEDTEVVDIMEEMYDEPDDEFDYGDDEIEEEMRAEDEAREKELAEKRAAYEEAKAAEKAMGDNMAPDPHDPVAQAEAVGYQTEKIAIVTTMVNKVIAKHRLYSGGIPEDIKMRVMGDLVDEYHKNGQVITPEFESIILNNWVGGSPENEPIERNITKNDKPEEEPKEEIKEAATININVEPDTPVTVNIDGETVEEISKDKVINIVVHEVSEEDMRSTTVIENSQLDGIITPYESDATDVPLTLPLSAYRCTMSGVSLFDIVKLSALQSGNPRDMDIKTWSLIYNHIKNPSIGKFKSFEDFLKHTDYRDMELLLWGAFVATADEVETIHFTCGNRNCRNHMEIKYNPRSIIHVDEKLVPPHYNTTHSVASGKAAVEHWEKVRSTHKIYELPHSKVLVELDDYTAWDYHNIKLPMMQEVYNRYRPDDGNMDMNNLSEEENEEMNFLLLFLLYIKSITINKNGKSYKYSNWKDIEKIISQHISNKDISILIAIINQTRQTESPISFYLENIKCNKCGREDERIPVNDIMRSLFFQLSSGLSNTTINFVETGKI